MKNLETKGFKELTCKELKEVEGGRWSWLGAIIIGAIAGICLGPIAAAVGFVAGGYFPG